MECDWQSDLNSVGASQGHTNNWGKVVIIQRNIVDNDMNWAALKLPGL